MLFHVCTGVGGTSLLMSWALTSLLWCRAGDRPFFLQFFNKQNGQPGVRRGTEEARALTVGLLAPFGPRSTPASSLPVLAWDEGAWNVFCLTRPLSKGSWAQSLTRDRGRANVDQ